MGFPRRRHRHITNAKGITPIGHSPSVAATAVNGQRRWQAHIVLLEAIPEVNGVRRGPHALAKDCRQHGLVQRLHQSSRNKALHQHIL